MKHNVRSPLAKWTLFTVVSASLSLSTLARPHATASEGLADGGCIWRVDRHPRVLADINTDGKADIVGFGNAGVWTALSTEDGGFAPAQLVLPEFGYNQAWRVDKHVRLLADINADIDNDGKPDIVGFGDAGVWTALSMGDAGLAPANFVLANLGADQGWTPSKHVRTMANINNDSQADIVAFGDAGVWTAISTGDGGFAPASFVLANFGANQAWTPSKHVRTMAVINNDSQADIMAFGDAGVWTALSTGDGGFGAAQFVLAEFGADKGWTPSKHVRTMATINNDSQADIVAFGDAGVWTALSTGDGGFGPAQFVLAEFGADKGWIPSKHVRTMADINNDGKADIVAFGDAGVWTALSTGDGGFAAAEFVLAEFGADKGWTPSKHVRTMADISNDSKADIVGFGDAGVWTALSTGDGGFAPAQFVLAHLGFGAAPLLLDNTECSGDVLDDCALREDVARDHHDTSYGALSNSAVRPLGGGEGYSNIVLRPLEVLDPALKIAAPIGVVVRTADELRAALLDARQSPRTIYVDDNAEIDLSYCAKTPAPRDCPDPRSGPGDCNDFTLSIPPNTTLASGRGPAGSRGARLFSRTFTFCPMLRVDGPGVRITGLRLHGPDSSIQNDDPIHCVGESRLSGVEVIGPTGSRWGTEIDNNEVSAWPGNGVLVIGVIGVRVHHNVFQFNRREEHNGTCDKDYGLGYPISVGPGSAIIEANVFDHNRHDIASDGQPGASYRATYNLVLTGAVSHSFDVHGGADRDDCTNIAGSAFVIHHNTFLQSSEPAVRIRGIPMRGALIYKNETHDLHAGHAFSQINAFGNFSVFDNRTGVNKFPAWFISFGGSTFWQWRQFEAQGMSGVAAADFDGDGAADVIRSTPTGWQWSKSAREGWAFLHTNKDPVPQLAFGDLVGLAHTDIVRATGTEWQVSETGTSQWRLLFTTNAAIASAAFADFEGDGKTDAFFADGTRWTIVQSFSPVVRRHHAQPFKLSELRFGNFAADSKVDVLRSTGSEWLVWDRVSQTWNQLNVSSIPLARLTFADFDGDGFTDIARSDNGKWFVSWGGKSGWQVLNTSDLDLRSQLIADFNGDRKADVLSRQSPDP